jgi:hypothetical protein
VTIENSDSTPSLMSAEEEMKIIKSIPILENELTWICRVTDESLKKSDVYVVDEKNKNY